jgi:cytochrome c-type biogenesis protein CcmH
MIRAAAALLALSLSCGGAFALSPDEMLTNPALEKRARTISAEVRCMVCQNESIDDSNAELARDLRVLVRERLVAGDTDGQVLDFLVARYGEFVLLKPRLHAGTLLLWGFPLGALAAGAVALIIAVRRRRADSPVTPPLTAGEEKRIREITGG